MKDDMETACMNELFGSHKQMIVQIYTKTDGMNTSILVARNNTVYYKNVIDVSELTGIQRAVSFVRHELDADTTEIYPDKVDIKEVLKDEFVSHCGKNPVKGENPNEQMVKMCETDLQSHNRWNMKMLMERQNEI